MSTAAISCSSNHITYFIAPRIPHAVTPKGQSVSICVSLCHFSSLPPRPLFFGSSWRLHRRGTYCFSSFICPAFIPSILLPSHSATESECCLHCRAIEQCSSWNRLHIDLFQSLLFCAWLWDVMNLSMLQAVLSIHTRCVSVFARIWFLCFYNGVGFKLASLYVCIPPIISLLQIKSWGSSSLLGWRSSRFSSSTPPLVKMLSKQSLWLRAEGNVRWSMRRRGMFVCVACLLWSFTHRNAVTVWRMAARCS